MARFAGFAFIVLLVWGLGESTAQTQETVQATLAAQIRTQGFACDKALKAVKDAKRSKPDHEVWVLTCSNATYRVSRVPDLAAKVEVIR
ncbi:hypothetical protein ABIB73_002912 [Bradyrhizobium sp. F1.4.3]|uniref:hypothetical protein n=1 Tax=Bradyrhizobium sp. F1.4.3 TaxID=3156356 RepID=UPI0033988297